MTHTRRIHATLYRRVGDAVPAGNLVGEVIGCAFCAVWFRRAWLTSFHRAQVLSPDGKEVRSIDRSVSTGIR